jgi:putative transcriptional regulator
MSISDRSPEHPRLTREEKNAIAADAKKELGMPSEPALRYERADLRPNVRTIRERLCLSQREFASRFGLSVKTLQHWEQGRTTPDRPAIVLLKTIEVAPGAVDLAVLALSRPLSLAFAGTLLVDPDERLERSPGNQLVRSSNDRFPFAA